MIFVQDELMIVLQILSYSQTIGREANDVVNQKEVYRNILRKYIPATAEVEIHIIGMEHGGEDPERDQIAAISQIKVTEILKSIKADVVGFESSWDEEFSIERYALGYLELRGYKVEDFPTQLMHQYVKELVNHPAGNSVLKYAEYNKDAKIVCVEYKELMALQLKLQKSLSLNLNNPKIKELYAAVSRLRGLIMIAKLGEYLSKQQKKKIVAIPVGYLHLIELIELQKELNAPWKFYNTTELNYIDLPSE